MPRIAYEGLLWADLETNGSNPHKGHRIWEATFILTDFELRELQRYSAVVRQDHESIQRAAEIPAIIEMHTDNGLIEDVQGPAAIRMDELELGVMEMLQNLNIKPGSLLLAGSGVAHFDRKFIDELLPGVAQYLNYAALDVGQVRRGFGQLGGAPLQARVPESFLDGIKAHRSEADTEAHILEGYWYKAQNQMHLDMIERLYYGDWEAYYADVASLSKTLRENNLP